MSRADHDRLKAEMLNKPELFIYNGPYPDDIADGIKRHMDSVNQRIIEARKQGWRDALEECANACARMCKESSDIGCASHYVHVREGQAMLASAFREVEDYIRALMTPGDGT